MKRVDFIRAGGLAVGCLFMSGCVDQSYKMIGRECVQVAKYEASADLIKRYVTSVSLYEGYQTRAHFDVLVMSASIRALAAALYTRKQGLGPVAYEALVAQHSAESSRELKLYVLTEIADQAHVSLSDKDSAWSLYITTAQGKVVRPRTIKEVDLSPEIRAIFGYRFLPFKKAYEVVFSATDLQGKPYFLPGNEATLTLAGAGMSSTITWPVEAAKSASIRQNDLLERQDDKSIWEALKAIAKPKKRDDDYYFC